MSTQIQFDIMLNDQDHRTPNDRPSPLFKFTFPKAPFEDLTGRPDDGVKGTLQWLKGDRIAYHTAYWFLGHEDPGHHAQLNGFRFHVQAAGALTLQINDKGMGELQPQGLVQYPYEGTENDVSFDTKYPGGTLLFAHHRPTSQPNMNLMGVYRIPPVSPINPKVKWYYQRMGIFAAVHDEYGPFARLLVSSMHPRYGFATLELGGAHFQGILKAINRGQIVLPGSEDGEPA